MRLLGLIAVCFLMVGHGLAQESPSPSITIPYIEVTQIHEYFMPENGADFYGARFSSDNSHIGIWGDGFVYLYNIAERQSEGVVYSMIDIADWLQWKPDGTVLLLPDGVYDLKTKTWLTQTGSLINQWSSVKPSQYFAQGQIWSLNQTEPLRTFKGDALAVTPDLSRILTMTYTSEQITLRVRDIVNRVDLGTYTYSDPQIPLPTKFSPDLTRVLLEGCCKIQVVDLPSGQIPLTITLREEPSVDPMTGEEMMMSPDMGGECSSLELNPAWSPDSNRLFYNDSVYDIASGTKLYTLPSSSTTAAWTGDGTRLITNTGVWDANTGQMLFSYPAVDLVEWRESTQRILGWKAGGVTIWDANGTVLLNAEHTGEDSRWCGGAIPVPPTWSADGQWLATWGLRAAYRLRVDGNAFISTANDDTLNLRAEPNTEAAIIDKLETHTNVDIIGGPQDNSGFTWWQVRLEDGREGWVVQSADNRQTLVPSASSEPYSPSIKIWYLP